MPCSITYPSTAFRVDARLSQCQQTKVSQLSPIIHRKDVLFTSAPASTSTFKYFCGGFSITAGGGVSWKRKEWYLYEPIIDILSKEEVAALEAREERNARFKRKLEDKEDILPSRYAHC